MKIGIILGTRPEIIKLAPIIKQSEREKIDYFIIHTNQHYSANLDSIFFEELELPKPKYNLNAGSGTHAEETGKMMIGIEKILEKEKPDCILVEGDTNSVLAGALASAKLQIPIGHIEAGLRSYDRKMPEEINRIMTDHISDYLFAPTKEARKILLKEGIPDKKIYVTGNTIADAVYQNLEISKKRENALENLCLKKGNYFLITCHRPSNVDNEKNFIGLLNQFKMLYDKFGIPMVFPMHPRSRKMLEKFNFKVPNGIKITEPAGYLDFLQLEKNAKLILTDSGGIQEEACILKVPCVTLRENTERPETIQAGGNMLMTGDLYKDCKKMLAKNRKWKNPFGNGNASEKILNILRKNYEK
ncbi:MAG: UDP-N-acetylglucosamine 2-epimerase (non-hydrolyzing) [Candidatus Paceibacterota bacterium]